MKPQNKFFTLIFMFFVFGIFISNFVSSEEVNYSVSSSYGGIQVSSIKYEPYPVNPGEYFDFWIHASLGTAKYAKFEMVQNFPFTLENSAEAINEYENIGSRDVVMHYKIRVDKDAVEGLNNLGLKISTQKYSSSEVVYPFEIYVSNAQTDFDLIVQDSSSSQVSLAIANIGKNVANSMIVRIPEQNGFKVTGTNGQMVGNLDAGDYSIVGFNLLPIGRNAGNLTVQIDYTDNIGVRRSLLKNVPFAGVSSGNFTAQVSGEAVPANFARGTFQRTTTPASGINWTAILLSFIVVGIILFFKKNPKLFNKSFNTLKKDGKKLEKLDVPAWIQKEKSKERSSRGK